MGRALRARLTGRRQGCLTGVWKPLGQKCTPRIAKIFYRVQWPHISRQSNEIGHHHDGYAVVGWVRRGPGSGQGGSAGCRDCHARCGVCASGLSSPRPRIRMGLPSPLRVGLAPSGLRLASRLALMRGGAARIAAKTGNSGLLPNSGTILLAPAFSLKRKSQHFFPWNKTAFCGVRRVWPAARLDVRCFLSVMH